MIGPINRLLAPALFCAALGVAQPANAVVYDIDIIDDDGSTFAGQVFCEMLCVSTFSRISCIIALTF